VPQTRLGRFARLSLAAGELAVSGAVEGLRRWGSGEPRGEALFNAANAQRLAERLARLRGAAMKLGQLVSMEGGDLLPPEFVRALEILRSDAAPMPHAQLAGVLGREWGKGWEARFEHFDWEPVASASIGQVHRARLRGGRELAIKVQYPGVARSIGADVDNVAVLLRLFNLLPLQIDVAGIATEAKRQLLQESDYLAEARAATEYARRVADEPHLVVPRVHPALTTARVLAMDWIESAPIDTAAELPQAQRDALGTTLERLLFRELFEFGLMQSDPNPANYRLDAEGRIVLLDFGATMRLAPDFVEHYRRIVRALLERDCAELAAGAAAIGYIDADEPAERLAAAIEVIELVCEPLRHRGRYDFGASDLPARARDAGLELGLRRGLLRSPPPATIFLHRKLAGSFFLLARLGARVDARELANQACNQTHFP
jgi:predicted unusual protein kinase regulating ubiquinone biosynthesis (AarF/ABC1/UbiB family)